MQPVCSFFARLFAGLLPAFLPSARFQSCYRLIFGIKKGCNLVSKRHYIATGRTLFIKRKLVLSRIPARRYVVYNKVPWLCVTDSRRFCRQVFNYNEGNFTCGLHACLSLYTHFTRRKPFFKFFKKKFANCILFYKKAFKSLNYRSCFQGLISFAAVYLYNLLLYRSAYSYTVALNKLHLII